MPRSQSGYDAMLDWRRLRESSLAQRGHCFHSKRSYVALGLQKNHLETAIIECPKDFLHERA